MLTVVGVGVWQGAHCTANLPVALTAATTSLSATAVMDHPAAETTVVTAAAASSPHQHAGAHTQRHPQDPGTTADDCQTVAATVAATTVTTAVAAPAGTRTISVRPGCGPRLTQRPIPGMTLAHIGVSRT